MLDLLDKDFKTAIIKAIDELLQIILKKKLKENPENFSKYLNGDYSEI